MEKLSFKKLIMLLAVVALFNGVSFAQGVAAAVQHAFENSVSRQQRGNQYVLTLLEAAQRAERSSFTDAMLIEDLNNIYVNLKLDHAILTGVVTLMKAAATAVSGYFVQRSSCSSVRGGIELRRPQFDHADMSQYLNK
jgi:hypothetical protein